MENIDDSIRLLRNAVAESTGVLPERIGHQTNLAVRLRDKYSTTGVQSYLEEAISIIREVVRHPEQYDQDQRARRLNILGAALGDRYQLTGIVTDLEECVEVIKQSVNIPVEDLSQRSRQLNNLAVGYMELFSINGEPTYLDDAIETARRAVECTPSGDADRATRLNNLSSHLCQRHSMKRQALDLEEAFQVMNESLDLTPEASPARGIGLHTLSCVFHEKYSHTKAIADLNLAIDKEQEAISMTPKDHPRFGRYLDTIGSWIGERFSQAGSVDDLEEAIRIGRQAVSLVPDISTAKILILNNLSGALSKRFLRTKEVQDIDEAILSLRKAIEIAPDGHQDRPMILNNLGSCLYNKFDLCAGTEDDLNEAMLLTKEAIELLPESHFDSDRSGYLANLSWLHYNNYYYIGAISEIDEAVKFGYEAINLLPDGHPNRPGCLNAVAVSLLESYQRTATLSQLENGIKLLREATKDIYRNHPDRVIYLNNLAVQLGNLYANSKSLSHLNDAIQAAQEAVSVSFVGCHDQPRAFNTLGNRLYDRYSQTRNGTDLDLAIQAHQEAVNRTPQNQLGYSERLIDLGISYATRYELTNLVDDIHEAIARCRLALTFAKGPLVRVQAGKKALRYCCVNSDWQEAYSIAGKCIHDIAEIASTGLRNSDNQHALIDAAGFTSDAAAVALQANQGPMKALHYLEQGRDILAGSLEITRSDLSDLEEKYPELAKELSQARRVLAEASARQGQPVKRNLGIVQASDTSQRHAASMEVQRVVFAIRGKEEFNDFERAPLNKNMTLAASKGPVIVINVSEYRCDAIIVERHQVTTVPLPDLSHVDVERRARQDLVGSRDTLEWLWYVIANPVLNALGFTEARPQKWPHLWWILTGQLTKFPIHAAGYHLDGSSATVLDRVVSSYSSSIKAILRGRREHRTQIPTRQALLVAMENTRPRLPFAVKEIKMLRELCSSMNVEPIEPGQHKEAIMTHLPGSKIFHFAGHGYTESSDPSKSYLLVDGKVDNQITVEELFQLNMRKHSPFLAYLSACGTGQLKDPRFSDENIHLISACHLAGFRHVIGTLWEVNDQTCMDIAKVTYETIKEGDLEDESVSLGLHRSIVILRDRWVSSVLGNLNSERRSTKRKGRQHPAESSRNLVPSDEEGNGQPSRKFVVEDSEDDDDSSLWSSHWVPYVHFGV
jgi:tetratricopeptide (TPR) repeat protein